ncbi:hypothetical protein P5673_001173 [Acropora cervicornis]|uniref:Uncharacterized protein n=1 Tax=Acropora cervicornis TaxID=6130 RepID=A0AAD9VGB3_ACRCE|nr:hypothetical protein P5673_001173 [Acropora cervicornis]
MSANLVPLCDKSNKPRLLAINFLSTCYSNTCTRIHHQQPVSQLEYHQPSLPSLLAIVDSAIAAKDARSPPSSKDIFKDFSKTKMVKSSYATVSMMRCFKVRYSTHSFPPLPGKVKSTPPYSISTIWVIFNMTIGRNGKFKPLDTVAHLNDQLQFSAQLISTDLDHQNNSTSKLRYKVHRMKSAFSLTSKRANRSFASSTENHDLILPISNNLPLVQRLQKAQPTGQYAANSKQATPARNKHTVMSKAALIESAIELRGCHQEQFYRNGRQISLHSTKRSNPPACRHDTTAYSQRMGFWGGTILPTSPLRYPF